MAIGERFQVNRALQITLYCTWLLLLFIQSAGERDILIATGQLNSAESTINCSPDGKTLLLNNLLILNGNLHIYLDSEGQLSSSGCSAFVKEGRKKIIQVTGLTVNIHAAKELSANASDATQITSTTALICPAALIDLLDVVQTAVAYSSALRYWGLPERNMNSVSVCGAAKNKLLPMLQLLLAGDFQLTTGHEWFMIRRAVFSVQDHTPYFVDDLEHELLWRLFSEQIKQTLLAGDGNNMQIYGVYRTLCNELANANTQQRTAIAIRLKEVERLHGQLKPSEGSGILIAGINVTNNGPSIGDVPYSIDVGPAPVPSVSQIRLLNGCNSALLISSTACSALQSRLLFMRPGKVVVEVTRGDENIEDSRFRRLAKLLHLKWLVLRTNDGKGGVLGGSRLVEFESLLSAANGQSKVLLFMPWEQLNNQLVGFKSACALSAYFNRTLVLPPIGYRHLPPSSAGALFDPAEFHWKPFENYFDLDKLSADLPCRFISNENFGLLFDDWRQHLSIRILYYGHGSNTTVPGQVRSYYKMLFGDRAVTTEEYLPDSFQLPLDRARLLFGGRGETVLAMSSMFWLYDFGRRVEYPLKKYYDYLSQPADFMYRKIVTALWPVMRIATQSMAIQAVKKNMRNGRQFVALHIRRGDYWKKCQTDFGPDSPYADSRMLRRCYATDESIIQLLRSRFPVDRALMIYICTNGRRGHAAVPPSHRKSDYDFTAFSSSLPPGWTVLMWEDLHAKINDPNEIALTEQMIAVGADYFIGNLWSSFSRHIQEWRALRNRSSDWI